MLRCYIDLALLMQSKARVPRGGSFNSIRLDYSVHLVVAELDFPDQLIPQESQPSGQSYIKYTVLKASL